MDKYVVQREGIQLSVFAPLRHAQYPTKMEGGGVKPVFLKFLLQIKKGTSLNG